MKIDGIAVVMNESTGEVREVPATADVTFHEEQGSTDDGQAGTSVGYSRRYSDAWERTFGKREAN